MDTHDRVSHEPVKQDHIGSIDDASHPLDSFGKVVFLIVLVEVALLIGLNLYEKSRITSLTNELQSKISELSSAENKSINDQVDQVLSGSEKLKVVLSSKIDWNTFYSKLNAVTPKNVRLASISVSDSGTFKADGETASMTSLAQALVAWQQGTDTIQTPFSSVTLASNGFSNDSAARRVTFSISGQIDLSRIR